MVCGRIGDGGVAAIIRAEFWRWLRIAEVGRAEEDDGGCGGDRDAAAADEEERAAEKEGIYLPRLPANDLRLSNDGVQGCQLHL